jgi:hypothetical protein
MPNRDSMDARQLWVEGIMILQESHFHATKLIKRLPQDSSTFSRGFHEVPGITFLVYENADYELTGNNVTLSRGSWGA